MLRKCLLCGIIVAAGAVTWNEYRLWSYRSPRGPLQGEEQSEAPSRCYLGDHKPTYFQPDAADQELATQQVYDQLRDTIVIDLSVAQKQTSEPATADTEEPATSGQFILGVGVNSEGGLVGSVVPVPTQFQKHSADGDCGAAKGPFAQACKKLTCWIWGTSPHDAGDGVESLQVMPRPIASDYHHDHPGCPYAGGCPYDGSAYRHSLPAARPASEEAQDAPPAKPKVEEKRKQPKLDTMEIRPGDLPTGWLRKPF